MRRSTIYSLTALVTGSVLVLLSGNAQAGWTEDFESYNAGSVLPGPWDEGDPDALGENFVTGGAGYLGGQGVVYGDNPPGNAWRRTPNSGVTELTVRLYSDSSESYPSRYYVGFHTDPTAGGDTFGNNDGVSLYLVTHPEGGFISFENPDYDNQDPRQFVSQGTAFSGQNVGIAGDTWYDVRITLNGDDTATAEYKEASSPSWLTVGATGIAAIGDPVNFAPNYVWIRGERGGRIDDITVNGDEIDGATEFTWVPTNLGDWADADNWSYLTGGWPTTRANSAEHTAIFGGNISGPTTVSTQDAVTVNRIEFNNATNSVAVAGLGSVNVAATETPCLSCPSVSVTGTHQFQTVVNLLADTTMNVASGSTLSFNNALNLTGNTLIKTGDGTVAINNQLTTADGNVDVQQGTISGNGTIGGDVTNSGGTASPGNSPGMLTIDGNYNQGSGGTLAIELGGNEAGADYDVLQVLGNASLAGTLDISLLDGFTPSGGDTFTVLTAGGELTDAGLTLGGSDAASFTMSIDTTNDWIMLMTVGGGGGVTGDYNGNGIVDAADYTLWRNNLGTNNPLQNDNIGGLVTEAHYLQWKNNFGNNAGSGSGAAVPEPVSACLLIVAWGGLSLVSRRREGAM